jgi:hypothetical protein
MQAVCSSETSDEYQQSTRRDIPEERIIQGKQAHCFVPSYFGESTLQICGERCGMADERGVTHLRRTGVANRTSAGHTSQVHVLPEKTENFSNYF